MKFLDSNVLAYAFYNNKFQDACQEAIKKGGVVNTLNLIEAFNIIEFETSRQNAVTCIKSLLKSNLNILDVNINTVFEAIKRSQKYKRLKFLDLLHYTSALLHNCQSILSYDKDFNKLDIPREVP